MFQNLDRFAKSFYLFCVPQIEDWIGYGSKPCAKKPPTSLRMQDDMAGSTKREGLQVLDTTY